MKRLRLRTHLTLFYIATLGLLLLVLGVACYRALALQLNAEVTSELDDLTAGLRGYVRFDDGKPEVAYNRDNPDEAAFVEGAIRYYQLYDLRSGELVARSTALDQLRIRFTPQELQTLRSGPRTFDLYVDQNRIRFSNTVISAPSREPYLLQVGIPMQATDRALGNLLTLLLWGIPAALLIVAIVGRWMAGRALNPLGDLAAATRRIGIAELHHRIPVRGADDELDEVSRAFNMTLARLEQAVGEMRQFTAALAHELRTPLTVLRGEAEIALMKARSDEDYRRVLLNQLEEFDRLNRIIGQLLTLARAEGGQIAIERQPLDLGALAVSVCDQLEPVAAAASVSLTCRPDEEVGVSGDPAWLERLIINLLDNALKFTPRGGRVVVRVTTVGPRASLEVVDTGSGIPADALPHVFERFFRADPARSRDIQGTGLGLTLVRWIAEQHGGAVEIASEPGEGTRVLVRLPRVEVPAALALPQLAEH
jgi:heavy metal sensor kinase